MITVSGFPSGMPLGPTSRAMSKNDSKSWSVLLTECDADAPAAVFSSYVPISIHPEFAKIILKCCCSRFRDRDQLAFKTFPEIHSILVRLESSVDRFNSTAVIWDR